MVDMIDKFNANINEFIERLRIKSLASGYVDVHKELNTIVFDMIAHVSYLL
jgi:hypothetical protein